MKPLFSILSLSVIAFALFAFQAGDQIALAMKAGNANEVAKHFGPQVELTLPNSEGTLSKTQATAKLSAFFRANQPTGYKPIHKGQSKLGLTYSIAELTTAEGTFRVSIYLKKSERSEAIQSLTIEAS